MADGVDLRIVELLLGHSQHLLALGIGEELAAAVEQLQGVPLPGVVRRRDDDATVGPVHDDSHLGPGRRAEARIDHVGTAGEQRALDQVGDHFPRDAGVAPDDNDGLAALGARGNQPHVGRGELHDIGRRQVLARRASDRTADARNRLDECHIPPKVYSLVRREKPGYLY